VCAARFEAFKVVKIEFVVFCVTVPCSVEDGYYLHLQGWSAWWAKSGHRYRQGM